MSYDKQESQERRARNRDSSASVLRSNGVDFDERSGGVHLIVKVSGTAAIDFWPGSGLWIERATQRRGRGVFKLVRLVRQLGQINGH